MEDSYVKLGKPIKLEEAVKKFGLERLHPIDQKLWDELYPSDLKTHIVTVIKKI